jgi:membrane protein
VVRGLRPFLGLLVEAAKEWVKDRCHTLGAALAFYALLSLAPFVLLVLTIAAVLLGQEEARRAVVVWVGRWLGADGANALRFLLARFGRGGITLHAVAAAGLVIGAWGFFAQLKESLETIWDVRREPLGLAKIKKTLLELALALVAALFALFSLAAGGFFAAMIERPEEARLVSWGKGFWQGSEIAFFFVVITLVSAALFKFLSEARLTWRDVFPGAVFTAFVYMAGRVLAAHYLAGLMTGAASDVALSVLVFMLWVYYTSQVFLLGAEFARVYTDRYGSFRKKAAVGKEGEAGKAGR